MTVSGRLVLGIAMVILPLSMSACVKASPQAQVKATALAKTGEKVQLFYGGNKLAKDEFCLNAIVTVYRYSTPHGGAMEKIEVGKIRITSILDDHYIEGVVVKGSINEGDVAVQPNSACLIRLPERII